MTRLTRANSVWSWAVFLARPPVAGLAVVEEVLEDMKGMFDPRSDTGLEFLGLLGEGLERPFHHGLDFAAPGRDVPLEYG